MNSSHSKRLVLAGLVGLGLCGFVATPASAAPPRVERNVDRALANGGDFEAPEAFDKIPEAARRKIEEIKGRSKLLATFRIRREGNDYYRATIQTKRSERIALVTADGAVRNVEDIRPEEFADYKAHTDAWYRDYDDRMIARTKHLLRESERVTASVEHPERINWDQCPASVRNTFTREAAGEKVDYVIRYRDHDQVIYQTTIDDGRDKRHMVQARPDGTIFNEGEYTKGGSYKGDEWKPHTIGFDDLPERVRDTVNKAVPSGRIPRVEVVKRRGRDFYTVECQTREGERYLTINDEGVCVADVTDPYLK